MSKYEDALRELIKLLPLTVRSNIRHILRGDEITDGQEVVLAMLDEIENEITKQEIEQETYMITLSRVNNRFERESDTMFDYVELKLDSIIENAAKKYDCKDPNEARNFVLTFLLAAITADIEGEVDYLVSSYREEVERKEEKAHGI